MTLFGKLETDVEINSAASKFYEIIHLRPHHLCNVCKNTIQTCELLEGEWGKVGSILYWNYFHDGKARAGKELVEAIDEEKLLITFKVVDGDILEHYKSFKYTIQGIQKDNGSLVHWSLEYEKQHHKIPESLEIGYMKFCVDMSKDLDAHLMEMEINKGTTC